MSVRTSDAQIDEAILDAAAGLFARQGFDRTSVQQVADAVGYSKTGLLHRFPSKAALLVAVDSLIEARLGEMTATLLAHPLGPERTHAALEGVTAVALQVPGLLEYEVDQLARQHDAADCGPLDKGVAQPFFTTLLGDDPTPEHQVRLMLALQLICNGALVAAKPPLRDLGDSLPSLLVDLAAAVAGIPA